MNELKNLSDAEIAQIEGGITCEEMVITIGAGIGGALGATLGGALGAPLGPVGSALAGGLWGGAGAGLGGLAGSIIAPDVCHM